jgi:chaperonin cofactor prefoldin
LYAKAAGQRRPSPTVQEIIVPETKTAATKEFHKIIKGLEAKIATLECGQMTPSTVTATLTSDIQTTARMDKFETFMTEMTKWMSEMKQIMQETHNQHNACNTYGNLGTQRTQNHVYKQHETPPSHQSKRANTSQKSDRGNLMITQPEDESCIQLFHNRDGKAYRVQMLGQERAHAQQEDMIQASPNNCI